jgi:hypothetical protein
MRVSSSSNHKACDIQFKSTLIIHPWTVLKLGIMTVPAYNTRWPIQLSLSRGITHVHQVVCMFLYHASASDSQHTKATKYIQDNNWTALLCHSVQMQLSVIRHQTCTSGHIPAMPPTCWNPTQGTKLEAIPSSIPHPQQTHSTPEPQLTDPALVMVNALVPFGTYHTQKMTPQ